MPLGGDLHLRGTLQACIIFLFILLKLGLPAIPVHPVQWSFPQSTSHQGITYILSRFICRYAMFIKDV